MKDDFADDSDEDEFFDATSGSAGTVSRGGSAAKSKAFPQVHSW